MGDGDGLRETNNHSVCESTLRKSRAELVSILTPKALGLHSDFELLKRSLFQRNNKLNSVDLLAL